MADGFVDISTATSGDIDQILAALRGETIPGLGFQFPPGTPAPAIPAAGGGSIVSPRGTLVFNPPPPEEIALQDAILQARARAAEQQQRFRAAASRAFAGLPPEEQEGLPARILQAFTGAGPLSGGPGAGPTTPEELIPRLLALGLTPQVATQFAQLQFPEVGLTPVRPEPFTLTPGGVRFAIDPTTGRPVPVATVPERPERLDLGVLGPVVAEMGTTEARIGKALNSGDPSRIREAMGVIQNARFLTQQRELIQARKRELQRLELQEDQPIARTLGSRANNFFDVKASAEPGKLVRIPVGTTLRDALKRGIELDDRDVQAVRAFDNSLRLVDEMDRVGRRVFTTNKPLLAALRAGKMRLQAAVDADPQGVGLLASSSGLLFNLARGLGNDSRVSDADVEFTRQTASLGFLQTREGFNQRIARLRRIFSAGRKGIFGEVSGAEQELLPPVVAPQRLSPGFSVSDR